METFDIWLSQRLKKLVGILIAIISSASFVSIISLIPSDLVKGVSFVTIDQSKIIISIANLAILIMFLIVFFNFREHYNKNKMYDLLNKGFQNNTFKFIRLPMNFNLRKHCTNVNEILILITNNILWIILTTALLYIVLLIDQLKILDSELYKSYKLFMMMIVNISTTYFIGKSYLALYFDIKKNDYAKYHILLILVLFLITLLYFIFLSTHNSNANAIFFLLGGILIGLSLMLLINEFDTLITKVSPKVLVFLYLYCFIQPCIFIFTSEKYIKYSILLVSIAIPLKTLLFTFIYFLVSKGGLFASLVFNSLIKKNIEKDENTIHRLLLECKESKQIDDKNEVHEGEIPPNITLFICKLNFENGQSIVFYNEGEVLLSFGLGTNENEINCMKIEISPKEKLRIFVDDLSNFGDLILCNNETEKFGNYKIEIESN
jgi:hypothetical protein